jgi:hypothetical protein
MKMKKKLIMLLAMLALIACNSDEPDGSEYLQDMMDCQTDGIYEGIIVTMPCTDQDFLNANFGVWCELKKAPDDAHEKKAPAPRCNIYFLRSDFPNTTLETGDEVKFRILKLGSARNLPFVYFWHRLYYKCIVEPV